MDRMLATAEVSQEPIGWLKFAALQNMDCMLGLWFVVSGRQPGTAKLARG